MQLYPFIEDSGHGWLQTTRAELKRLGILDKISHYSYQCGIYVYLEEDCDAAVFDKAKKEKGEEYKPEFNYIDGHCFVRNLQPFHS